MQPDMLRCKINCKLNTLDMQLYLSTL